MNQPVQGIVVGLIAGFYDVQVNDQVLRTRARGVFRKRGEKPQVGDLVDIIIDEQGTNYLTKVHPRKNQLARPPLANVSHVLLVISAVEPDFSSLLLDRFLTYFAYEHVQVVIYLSKADLASSQQLATIAQQLGYYEQYYPVFMKKRALETYLLSEIKAQQIWTLAGQSGAGKSTLLNFLKDANQQTGQISQALNRGKHTTRKVELFSYGAGLIADTPGFSSIDLTQIKLLDLPTYFIDFAQYSEQCKFRNCIHVNEPGCAVKQAVQAQIMPEIRYQSYLLQRQEIAEGRTPEYLK